MITHITPREQKLANDIDEQGRQLVCWRDRALAAEMELAQLRAAQGKPVATVYETANGFGIHIHGSVHSGQPLYAAPPAQPAAPLTDEKIDEIFAAHHDPMQNPWVNYRRFARAIEAAIRKGE